MGSTERKRRIRATLRMVKEHLGCHFCGEKYGYCLDFHHFLGIKEFTVAQYVNRHANIEELARELNKCMVVCKNCHKKVRKGKLEIVEEEVENPSLLFARWMGLSPF